MSKKHIVVEKGVILCEHGAEVELISSVPNHVVGGEKPLFTTDFLGAMIKGCSYNSNVGGQCKQVASIPSAITESNVSNQGGNYLLRVDGCQTDNGSSLILVDPGQTNSTVSVKQTGASNSAVVEALKNTIVNSKKNIQNEKYRIYPLRKSDKEVRGLRGLRDFRVMKNYHYANEYTHERIVPKTEAYLYMSIDGVTQEYEVINRGDYFRPQISQVYFKDDKNVLRRYLPVYVEGKIPELVYSNIRLTRIKGTETYAGLSKLTSKSVDLSHTKLSCVTHHKIFSKAVTHEQKAFEKEKLISLKEARNINKTYLNAVVYLDDPIGEVEDLYHKMESSFHLAYAHNKGTVDEIRAKNRYAYAVADMLEYLYVDKNEQVALNTNILEMKKQYKIMQNIILYHFIDTLPSTKSRKIRNKAGDLVKEESYNPKADIKLNLSKFINPYYDFAKNYFDETQFISKSFFPRIPMFQIQMDRTLYMYEEDFEQKNNGKPSTAYAIANIKPLKFGAKNFKDLNTMERLSFLIFTLAYHEDFQEERSKFTKLLEAREKFYYLLKTTKPLPSINDKSITEVQGELDSQSELTVLLQSKDKKGNLFDEFESLETLHKELSFDTSFAKKRNAADNLGFQSLKLGKINKTFYYDKAMLTPKTIAKSISKKLSAKAKGNGTSVADLLKSYTEISAGLKDQALLEYYNLSMNLAYMLCAPRVVLDSESDILSMFNKGHESLNDFVINLSKGMEKIEDVKDALSLHHKEIKEHYLNAIYALVAHAMMQDDSTRKTNALKLLNFIPIDTKKSKEELSNINDHSYSKDLKIKDEVNERYEQLKNLNTISSKIGDLHNNLPEETQTSLTTTSNSTYGGNVVDDAFDADLLEDISKKSYKGLLTSTKGLAFFMTIGSLVEYSQKGNKEKLKLYNFIGAANDLISVSTAMAEKGAKHLSQGSIKSVSTVIDKLATADSQSLKLIAKLGVIGVLVTSINDIKKLDANDTDGIIATTTKNAIVMVLLLSPGWVAVGGIMAVELAWIFLKDSFVDSAMQIYLRKNLYFNNKEAEDTTSGGSSATLVRTMIKKYQAPKSSYLSPILLETLQESSAKYVYKTKANQSGFGIKGFDSINEIRTFIADNYNDNKTVFDTAMSNELATLKQVLYGMTLEADEEASPVIKLNSSTLNNKYLPTISYKTAIRFPEDILKNNEYIIIRKDDTYLNIDKTDTSSFIQHARYSSYDVLKDYHSNDRKELLEKGTNDKRSVIIVNKDIILRYDIKYQVMTTWLFGSETGKVLQIKELKQVALETKDNDYINSLIRDKEANNV